MNSNILNFNLISIEELETIHDYLNKGNFPNGHVFRKAALVSLGLSEETIPSTEFKWEEKVGSRRDELIEDIVSLLYPPKTKKKKYIE